MVSHHLRSIAAVAALAVAAAHAQDKKKDPDEIGNRDVSKGINLYSIEKEMALGKALAQNVQSESRVIEDPIVAEYVNRIGQNLVRNSDAKFPFVFKVIEGEPINAFALPGGYFFVYTGLILHADSEAELAAAMAHEIAHGAARHSTRQASRGQIANIATIPLIFVGGWGGVAGRQGAGLLVPTSMLAFSRGFEEEADMLGLQYLYKTGYDPTALVDFFEKLQALERRKPGTLARWFSTHPANEDRIRNSQKNIQEQLKPKADYVINTSEFEQVRTRLANLLNTQKAVTRPTLHRSPATKQDSNDPALGSDTDRPTLKRRPNPDLFRNVIAMARVK